VDSVDNHDFNSVMKVPVIISGDKGTIFIKVVKEIARGEFSQIDGGGVGGGGAEAGICEQLLTVQTGISQLCYDIQVNSDAKIEFM
jgi:hypothetical protein